MNLTDILATPAALRAGETTLIDGQVAMCINPEARYGGGAGPIWAVENQSAQFTTRRHKAYLEGICRKVQPRRKLLAIEITKGPTWGRFAMGTLVFLHVQSINRYHPSSDVGSRLVRQSQVLRSKVVAEQAFEDLSLAELEQALSCEHQDMISKLLGKANYQLVHALCKDYFHVCMQMQLSQGRCSAVMETRAAKAVQQLAQALSMMTGEASPTNNNDKDPTNDE